jgi:hypothetical protein
MKYFRGDLYVNNLVNAIAEVIAYCVAGAIAKYFGLRFTFTVSYLISIAGMAGMLLTKTMDQRILSMFLISSKFGVSITTNAAYLANYKIFPVSIVATMFGICNIFARIATMFAPYIAEIKPDSVSQTVFICLMMVGWTANLFIIHNDSEEEPILDKNGKLEEKN